MSNGLYTDAEIDAYLEFEDRMERRAAEGAAKLLSKLNRADLFLLARHYGIKSPEIYAESSYWSKGGKDELISEIVPHYLEGR